MKRQSRTQKIVQGNRKRIKGEKDADRKRCADAILHHDRGIVIRARVAARKLAEMLAGMTPEGLKAYYMHQDMLKASKALAG